MSIAKTRDTSFATAILNTYAGVQKLTPLSRFDTLRTANSVYSLAGKR
jgi:hypothetical protein